MHGTQTSRTPPQLPPALPASHPRPDRTRCRRLGTEPRLIVRATPTRAARTIASRHRHGRCKFRVPIPAQHINHKAVNKDNLNPGGNGHAAPKAISKNPASCRDR